MGRRHSQPARVRVTIAKRGCGCLLTVLDGGRLGRRGRCTLGAGGRVVTPEQVLLRCCFGLGLGRRRRRSFAAAAAEEIVVRVAAKQPTTPGPRGRGGGGWWGDIVIAVAVPKQPAPRRFPHRRRRCLLWRRGRGRRGHRRRLALCGHNDRLSFGVFRDDFCQRREK